MKLKGFLLYILVLNILFAVTQYPYYLRTKEAPPKYMSPNIHTYSVDYYTYIATIREGKDGSWTLPALYTSEPAQTTVNYSFYLWLGQISRFTGSTPVDMYHIAQVIFFECFIAALYLLVVELVGEKIAFWGLFAGFFAFPPFLFLHSQTGINGYTNIPVAWVYNQPFYRVDLMPHHFASAALLFAVMRWFLTNKTKPFISWAAAAVASFLSTFFHPASGLMLVLGLGSTCGIWILRQLRKTRTISYPLVFKTAVIVLSSLAAIGITLFETTKGFPWSQWNKFDIAYLSSFPTFSADFFIALWSLMIIGVPVALYFIIKPKNLSFVLLGVWALLAYVVLPLAVPLGISRYRLVFIFPYVPLGVLTAWGVHRILEKVHSAQLRFVVGVVVVGLYVAVTVPVFLPYFRSHLWAEKGNRTPDVYIPVNVMAAYGYLEAHRERYAVLLSNVTGGLAAPSFARVRSYVGHNALTKDFERKMWESTMFYGGTFDSQSAQTFIKNNTIRYIMYGPAEHWGFDITSYGINMKPVFEKGDTVLYQVQ